MPPRRFHRYRTLSTRVAHAYYKYGCFCSSHPIVTILFSIATLLLLSYPLTRCRLKLSAPFEIITTDDMSNDSLRRMVGKEADLARHASWLFDGGKRRPPMAFVQQIIVKARVQPWNSFELTPTDAVKGPLQLAFDLVEKLNSLRYEPSPSTSESLDDYCFRVQHPESSATFHAGRLPSHKCLILAPSILWGNNRQKFYEDNNVLGTIFEPSCTPSLCLRNFFFGMEDCHTGIKRHYRTNRQRDILFAVTIILHKYDERFLDALRRHLESDSAFTVDQSEAHPERQQRDSKFIFIYYLRQKDFLQHIPLVLSYCLLFVYLYFSVRKIEMVKSKWGLAFSAVFTVAASLVMGTGICVNFDLIPRLWRGDLFPYLAMILGIENTLCLTRSVVSTPVTLPVGLRIAHGLSREGWLITKNFLIELAVLLVGVLTRIPEIQEFCTLGTIGLVVDFYMQLFFYAPCLTFDLLRFDQVEIQRLSVMQLSMNPVELVPYPPVRCPVVQCLSKVFPSIKSKTSSFDVESMDSVRRTRSVSSVWPDDQPGQSHEQNVEESNERRGSFGRQMGHRRAASNSSSDIALNMEPQGATNLAEALLRKVPLPRRLKILLFWSRYRYCQQIFIVVIVVWISWLGLIVHQWHLIGKFSVGLSSLGTVENQSISSDQNLASAFSDFDKPMDTNHSIGGATVESSWVYWARDQRTTFRWWPTLFNLYNISLTGQYVVLLPRVMLNSKITPEQAKLVRSGVEASARDDHANSHESNDRRGGMATGLMSDLGVRISWLEFQMFAVLIMSAGIFLTVGGFILYVCFVGGDSAADSIYETDASPWRNNSGFAGGRSFKRTHKRIGSKTIVEAVPLLFSRHEYDVEFVAYSNEKLVSACLGGRILIWDSKTADVLHQIRPYEARVIPGTSADAELRRRRTAMANLRNAGEVDDNPFRFLQTDDNDQQPLAAVWCLDVQNQLVAAGFSNGDIELYDLSTGSLRGKAATIGGAGATQICLKGSHVIVARLNGHLDFMELRLLQLGSPQRQIDARVVQQYLQCHLLKSTTAHQHQINRLSTTTMGVITASDDHTLKLFDLHKYSCICTFYGHNAPVINVTIDQEMQMMYTSCTDGLVCIWDLVDRCLIRTLSELSYTSSPVALAFTNSLLVGHAQDGGVWIWKKCSGELLTRIKAETRRTPSGKEKDMEYNNNVLDIPSLTILGNNLAVTANRNCLRFWDLEYKAMLREVKLEDTNGIYGSSIKNLISVDGFSVICSKGNVLYRVDFPVIHSD